MDAVEVPSWDLHEGTHLCMICSGNLPSQSMKLPAFPRALRAERIVQLAGLDLGGPERPKASGTRTAQRDP
eukprot:6503053-Pyramimonas_sp.AAC.1